MKYFFLYLVFLSLFTIGVFAQQKKFIEGIVYSKTSFPGHPLNDSIKKLDFESGDFVDQYKVIDALKKQQKSIKAENEQDVKDAFFISAIMLIPSYSKMYFSPFKVLVKTDALGYYQETLIDNEKKKGITTLSDRNKVNQGTINFNIGDVKEVWHKYNINAEQYTMQKTTETSVVAGYSCKKIIYTFNGTSRGPAGNMLLNMQPQKVTAWYSDELSPALNLTHPLYFEMEKAVLKFEIEYNRDKKNKTLVEIVKLEPQKLEEEKLVVTELAPVIQHKNGEQEGSMLILQVLMNAFALLTK